MLIFVSYPIFLTSYIKTDDRIIVILYYDFKEGESI